VKNDEDEDYEDVDAVAEEAEDLEEAFAD